MKINDYVRTNQGIAKYLGISKEQRFDEEYDIYLFDECIFDNWNSIDIDKIEDYTFKSSPNIIDLIEVGDILILKDVVKYQQVLSISNERLELSNYIYCDLQNGKDILSEDLISIITHEQLKNIEYKLGDK